MGPENYIEPPPPKFQLGDNVTWGDGATGTVIAPPGKTIKVLGHLNQKTHFFPNNMRNLRIVEPEQPFIDEIDGGGKKNKKKKTKRKKKASKKKRTSKKKRIGNIVV
jgi:hypothetical protein